MKKEAKFFYCPGPRCHYSRHSIDESAQELKGKRLCRECYDAGYRLVIGVVVKWRDKT